MDLFKAGSISSVFLDDWASLLLSCTHNVGHRSARGRPRLSMHAKVQLKSGKFTSKKYIATVKKIRPGFSF